MKRKVNISLSLDWKFYCFVIGVFIIAIIGFSYAYGSVNPTVMGHSSGEIEVDLSSIQSGINTQINSITNNITQLKNYIVALETTVNKLKWENVSLSDTSKFNSNCEYRAFIKSSNVDYLVYPVVVTDLTLILEYNAGGIYQTGDISIPSGSSFTEVYVGKVYLAYNSKGVIRKDYANIDFVGTTLYSTQSSTILALQKRCP